MGTRTHRSLAAGVFTGSLLIVALATPLRAGQDAATPTYEGGSLYRTYCASCHGPAGLGDGPVAQHLRKPPPNLTQIAKLNQGVFPVEKVTRAIDGRDVVRPHGGSDMPVWGDAFTRTTTANDPESVRLRIEALVRYLEKIQERPAGN